MTTSVEEQVRIRQAVLLVRMLPPLIIGNLAAVGLTFLMAWPYFEVSKASAALLALQVLIQVPMIVRWLRYRNRPRPARVSVQHIRNLTISSAVVGIGWGITAIVLMPHLDPYGRLFIGSILAMLSFGAVASIGPIRGACLADALSMMFLLAFAYASEAALGHWLELVAAAVIVVAVVQFARISYRDLRDNVEIEVENARLLEDRLAAEHRRREEESRRLHEQNALVAKVAEADRQLRLAVDSIGEGFVFCDHTDRFVICNRRFIDIFPAAAGVIGPATTLEQFFRRSIVPRVEPENRAAIEGWLAWRRGEGEGATRGISIELDDGRVVDVLDQRVPEGGVVSVLRDVTEVAISEKALRESEHRLAEAQRVAGLGWILIDLDDQSRTWSDGARKMFGIAEDAGPMTGERWRARLHPDFANIPYIFDLGFDSGERNYRIVRPGGEIRYIHEDFRIERDDTGRKRRAFITLMDLTALHAAREKAEVAANAKAEFLATMSHEIRTPLNGVIGALEILTDEALSESQLIYVNTARESAETLLVLINDILDFSKIEADRLELKADVFSPRHLIESVSRMMKTAAKSKSLDFLVDVDAGMPKLLIGDEQRLRQILVNLAGNAVKFTDEGRVSVRSRTRMAAEDECVLTVEVEDTGIGISPEHHAKLFERFSQVDQTSVRPFGGTGLGLSICKNLVDLMGGRIGFESALHRGSRFWFEVPLDIAGEGAAARVDSADVETVALGRPLRILLAEDNPTNRRILSALLEKLGHEVKTAADGVEAAEVASRGDYDVVLMDLQMPRMDGFHATQSIRSFVGERGRVPIVALTANATEGVAERCLGAGMNGYLSKPVRSSELISTIARILKEGKAIPIVAPPNSQSEPEIFDRAYVDDLKEAIGADGLRGIAVKFLDTLDLQLDELAALRSVNGERYAQAAHKLASAALGLGLSGLGKLLRDIENAALAGDRKTADSLAARIPQAARAGRDALRNNFEA